MPRKMLISGIILLLLFSAFPAAGKSFETDRLIVRDIAGQLAPGKFEQLAARIDATLAEVINFWSAQPKSTELGKIIVELEQPLPGDVATSFFLQRQENGRKVRVIRVFGGTDHPRQLAHKLTSALFPHPDILIRNMMGEAAESRFGNPLSFPMCGFNKNEWVMALLQADAYIPIAHMGPEQGDWGKEIVNNTPTVKDRRRQHACYLEAGSFGEFLINAYGIEKMKKFYRLSKNKPRPWEEAFGAALENLEAKWLEEIKLSTGSKAANVATLLNLWRINPGTACFAAQDLAAGK